MRVLAVKRAPNGQWRTLFVASLEGKQVSLYISGDRSFVAKRLGWHLSRAAAALRELHPRHAFEIAEEANAVCLGWQELVRATFDPRTREVYAQWDRAVMLAVDETIAVYDDATAPRPRPNRG